MAKNAEQNITEYYGAAAMDIIFAATQATAAEKEERIRNHLLFETLYKNPGKERAAGALQSYSRTPHLNIRQAFSSATEYLPADTNVTVYFTDRKSNRLLLRVDPISGQEELSGADRAYLVYEFYPEHEAIYISRIQSGAQKAQGIGSAMLLSQLPFWAKLGVTKIDLAASTEKACAFYKKLGFEVVDSIPEKDCSILTPMRLDFNQQDQSTRFFSAMERRLENGKSPLSLPGVSLVL